MPPSTSMSASTSLQIPSVDSNPGPSRHYNQQSPSAQAAAVAASRPVSVAVHPTSPGSANPSAASRRQRASHTVVSPTSNSQPHSSSSHPNPPDDTQTHTDVYSHPAAVAYAAAHPRRTIPKFGPYLLLQTLGEGEFGKVKLGLHNQWGEEVAVKLIRRGNVDSTVRMSKVEREIEVLKTLKHPNIVRLYDVIETDKYIGIILEYASGGELFDHILAHRYLRERDAAKLFSQLISGVWYIHQKKIVHRDLKLENLLLDRHRNVIITDFGFANRFEHRSDDLMQTSCGSPCYAAPELVISEGLYVGSAVDIWSCGVILYAMLAGYLPFDDDPANPDGDNINLLYKYIVNTPLSFPDYISPEARDLLGMMLVPDPTRRSSLEGVMRHPWLAAYAAPRTDGVPAAFGKTVEDLEQAAMEQHQQKRQAYQKQMKANALTSNALSPTSRSQSQTHRPDHGTTAPSNSARSRSTQPEYLYDSSVDQSMVSPSPVVNTTPTSNGIPRKNYDSPAALGLSDDDPFAAPGTSSANSGPVVITTTTTTTTTNSRQRSSEEGARTNASLAPNDPKAQSPSKSHKSNGSGGGGSFRHTIQVEYDEPSTKAGRKSEDKKRERSGSQGQTSNNGAASSHLQNGQPPQTPKERRPSQGGPTKPLPPNPTIPTSNTPSSYRSQASPTTPKSSLIPFSNSVTPTKSSPRNNNTPSMDNPNISISSPPATPIHAMHAVTPSEPQIDKDKETSSQTSASSMKKGHKKGKSSIDKLGLGKIFGSGGFSNPGQASPGTNGEASSSTQSYVSGISARVPSDGQGSATSVILSPVGENDSASGKKSRRNTLTVMVEPFTRSVRNRNKGKTASTPLTADGASAANLGSKMKSHLLRQQPQSAVVPSADTALPAPVAGDDAVELGADGVTGMQASTNKAKKVMQWFRTKSKGRDSVSLGGAPEYEDDGALREKGVPTSSRYKKGYSASSSTVNQTSMSTSGLGLKEMNMVPVHVMVTTPTSAVSRSAASPMLSHPQRSVSSATESSMTPGWGKRFRNSVTVGGPPNSHYQQSSSSAKAHPHSQLRVHHGAVDQTTITTRPPREVMSHVREVLEGMGVEVQLESEYKYRCIRAKKRRGTMGPASGTAVGGSVGPGGLAAVTMVGSAASNGVDKRGLPLPSPSAFSGTGGMLRGLLMRRQSSQVSATGVGSSSQPSLPFDDEGSVVVNEPLILLPEAAYGDPSQDAGDEVRFSVELTRLDRLNDTFSLDIRRLKGNLRSYKFLYDTLRERADLQR